MAFVQECSQEENGSLLTGNWSLAVGSLRYVVRAALDRRQRIAKQGGRAVPATMFRLKVFRSWIHPAKWPTRCLAFLIGHRTSARYGLPFDRLYYNDHLQDKYHYN